MQNNTYRYPGWHFFKEVQTSPVFKGDVKAIFSVDQLENSPVFMGLYIPGFSNREYTKVKAPHTFEAPAPYDDLATPTLVIRKKGEAWTEPFVVVYEPFGGNTKKASILSVEKLEQDGIYKGLKITSETAAETLVQYVITQLKDQSYQDKSRGIYFKGTFAIITLNAENRLQNMYIGEGEKLQFGTNILKPERNKSAAYKEF